MDNYVDFYMFDNAEDYANSLCNRTQEPVLICRAKDWRERIYKYAVMQAELHSRGLYDRFDALLAIY